MKKQKSKALPTEALQYRQDLLPITTREHTSYYTRCSENHNNTC